MKKVNKKKPVIDEDFIIDSLASLAEDVVDLSDKQEETSDNIAGLIKVLDVAAEVAKKTAENLQLHQKEIKALSDSIQETDKVWWWILAILVWLVVLTWWVGYYVFF